MAHAHEAETDAFDEVFAAVNHPRRLAAIGAMALAAAASYFALHQSLGLRFDWIGLVATLVGGYPIWMEAWEAIREKQINMEITMALGVVAALAIGQFATAAIIVAFTLFSMYLEDLTRSRGKRALEVLLRGAPETATVRRDGSWVDVRAEDLHVGDIILVKPGEKVPADGKILTGESSVSEAAITGEPAMRPKSPGSRVFASTINGNAALEVEVQQRGEDTTYARIIRLVKEAGDRRGKTQRLADKVAQGIVYVVLTVATITYLVTQDWTTTISVILVAGACGVAAGTPLAILATTAKSARRGTIVKGGEGVEAMARIDTVVFDKTGTLTRGTPAVHKVAQLDGMPKDDFLATVASLEEGSDHPIAIALRTAAKPRGTATGVEYVAGRGLRGNVEHLQVMVGNLAMMRDASVAVPPSAAAEEQDAQRLGHVVVFGAIGGQLRGAIHLVDEVRPEARQAVQRLKELGLRTIMLTGDKEGPAREVATQVGIDEVHAQLLPEDKIRIVQRLKAEGRRVCFVGDGINDAPALAESHVGVAVAAGSEAAMETADVLLMNNDLGALADTIKASRRSQRVILFNFAGTMVVDLVGVALAAFGFLGPLLAAFVHVGSELVFVANSARLFAGSSK
ncbi:MAG: heavy metal translocating P-type ATPase [Thermoplasmatota archaeon]